MKTRFCLLCLCLTMVGCGNTEQPINTTRLAADSANYAQMAVAEIVETAERIPNSTGWFEVLRLPNQVYAFWEPGHVEKVNSFLIIGEERDLLYDTGMGIADIQLAIEEVRHAESLPNKPLMVVNSHNHLDHNGGNKHFPRIWTVDDAWAVARLIAGVPSGEAGGFVGYWEQLTPHPGITPPAGFSPIEHGIPPYPKDQISFLEEGQVIDIGGRTFSVIRTYSHSPDGIALYSPEDGMFFGGDTFYGSDFLVTDIELLADDLRRIEKLPIKWHYASHGAQLIVAMQQGQQLAAVQRIINGEGTPGQTSFAGFELPQQTLEGVSVTIAKEILLY